MTATTDPGKTHSYEDDCQPPHERPNAGRLGRAELTNALHAAEQRARTAERERDQEHDAAVELRLRLNVALNERDRWWADAERLREELEVTPACREEAASYRAEIEALKTENTILQRTAELQLALVTATADVVEAAREMDAVYWNPDPRVNTHAAETLHAAIAALDKADT